ncbi:MAG TPA: FIST N-terminal domain-containing protein [Chitinophagaceae bacterium]|nr:FIST N-terminal domain-containing protein [Chitinophagaceae bacterium]
MIAKTIKGKSTAEIKLALEQSLSDNNKPSLAIVFISVKQDIEAISELLNEKNIQVFGVTTAGEFIDGEVEGGSVAILLMDINPDFFKIELIETSQDAAFEDAQRLAVIGKQAFSKPAFIIANSGVAMDGEPFVEGIMQAFANDPITSEKEVTIFGGKAGDDLELKSTFVFTNEKSNDNAIIALIIDEDKISVSGIATCGWKAIGTTKTVTKSEGSTVYTIDDKPALDILMNYLGVDIKNDVETDVTTFLSSWYYPLEVERENADPVIRTAMFANKEDRSLICSGRVPQGSKIKFSMPPDFDSIDAVVADCKRIKTEAEDADALIMFSCVSRHLSFGMVVKDEIERVQKIWNVPMVGFFTYGEYGRSLPAAQAGKTGKNEYHNNACCLVVLKEK